MAKKNNKNRGVFTRKTKSGLSFGIDYIHPQTGQRVRKILKGVTSEAEAKKLRRIELADAERGAIDKAYGIKEKGRPVPFEGMVKAYLKWARENKDSWQTDEHRSKPLLRAFKSKLLSDINPFMVEKYKAERAKTVQKSTINKELIFASQVFEKAVEWKKFNGENPFLVASRFKIKKGKKPGALSPEQVLSIRDQITHPVKRDMVGFAFYTRWRIGEIRKLKWEDVNLKTGTAWIVDPKNSETVEIVLSDEALEIVRRQEHRGPYVFCKLNGKAWKTNLQDQIKNAAKRAGVSLPPFKKWHIFRRTWASEFLNAGGHVEDLRVQGNWKDISMPLYYAEAQGVEARRGVLNRIPSLDGLEDNGTEMALDGEVVELTA